MLDDHALLAAMVDTRLRRALGLALDNAIVDLVADDDDIPAAASILAAVGALMAEGHGDLTAVLHPDDLGDVGTVADLTGLGVGAILASAQLTAGTSLVGSLAAGVQLRTVGPARVLVSDSHADTFTKNELVILAEQRVAYGVCDPWALRLVGDGAAARSAGSKHRAA